LQKELKAFFVIYKKVFPMEVICLQDEAFYALVEQVVQRIKETNGIKEDKWVSPEEAMKKLRITSKTTLQKLRDTGAIRFSHPEKKLILYDIDSIYEYLEKYAQETF
jgi:5,10-methenyltetrahydromethanopterin hydrogenase